MRRAFVLVTLLMAASVAAAGLFQHKVAPADLNGLTKMAVHVRLGDTFHAMIYGTTVFQNKGFDAPVPQWGMDPFASTQVIDTLNSAGRLAAVPLDTTGLDLTELYKKSGAILDSRRSRGRAAREGAPAGRRCSHGDRDAAVGWSG